MTSKEIIRKAIASAGISQMKFSEMLGYSSKTSVGAILGKNNSLRSDVFCKWLDALGYEVVIRPKDRRDDIEWILTFDETDDTETVAEIRSELKPPEK